MHVHYVHSSNVQVPSANAVQTMRMCEAFGKEGAHVQLFYPRYLWGNVVPLPECYAYYGVSRTFPLRPLPAPFTSALMRVPAYLPAAKLWAYSLETLRGAMNGHDGRGVIYTRCATAAATLPFLRRLHRHRPLVVFEAHEYPRDRQRARALRFVDAVVAITHAAADELHEGLGLPRERLLVAPDGVPESWLDPIDREEARRLLGLRADRPLAIYTGKVHPDTLALLFDTAKALSSRADLVVVGAPPGDVADASRRAASLQERSDADGLSIRFVGPQRSDRVRLYQCAADVLIAPYSGALRWARYASPLKIFEYMAAGRPMVVSDLPVLREVLQHERTAWLVPPAAGAAIAEGIRTLLDRPDLAAGLAARAREEAPRYTWTRRARTILDFLEDSSWKGR